MVTNGTLKDLLSYRDDVVCSSVFGQCENMLCPVFIVAIASMLQTPGVAFFFFFLFFLYVQGKCFCITH